ncbi:MAG: penicillin-binding protein [Acidimicrobiales bacterium]|nr:MAG: penicillin-binding protein [Acidimicrobiales bacterium]
MTRRIQFLGVCSILAFGLLLGATSFWQVVRGEELREHPLNTRRIVRDFNSDRGSIETIDGVLLADSQVVRHPQFKRVRRYAHPELYAHITGYFSFALGASGVERVYHDELVGRTFQQRLRSLRDLLAGSEPSVGNLVLTLRDSLQRAAASALGTRRGSVVLLDPRDGAILAMWSTPSYDPNDLSSLDLERAARNKRTLDESPDKPLLARTYQERFFPGSTFKIVTAAAGLQMGILPDATFPVTTSYTPPLTDKPIRNFGGSACGGDFYRALARSCNTAFARLAVEVGPEAMIREAREFGFGDAIPIDLPDPAVSVFPTDFTRDTPRLAQAGIGQNDVQATPLHMALVASAVATGGEMPVPHVLARVVDSRGDTVLAARKRVWRRPLSDEEAAVLQTGMERVVSEGTATALAIPGLRVGAKTGTAQLGTNPPSQHAWVIGYAAREGEPPSVAFAVLVEGTPGSASEQTGGRVAAPIAKALLEIAFGVR